MVNISRSLESRQDRRSAICLLQWRRLGELGKCLGHLERNHASRWGSYAAHGHDRARRGALSCQPRMGAVLSDCPTACSPAAGRWRDKTVWTIVNRNEYDVSRTSDVGSGKGRSALLRSLSRRGTEARSRRATTTFLSFAIEAHGFGAVLATTGEPDAAMQQLMAKMKSHDGETAVQLFRRMEDVAAAASRNSSRPSAAPSAPEGMVADSRRRLRLQSRAALRSKAAMTSVSMCNIHGKTCRGVFMSTRCTSMPFYIDKYPVTNAEFKKFLDADPLPSEGRSEFLKDWKNGTYPEGWDNKPVTWVSLEDARAYAMGR